MRPCMDALVTCRKGIFSGDVIKYKAEISILPSPLCSFMHKKFYLEYAANITSFMLRSFRYVATIHGCMFHYLSVNMWLERYSGQFQVLKMWQIFVILSHDSTRSHLVHTRASLTNQVWQEEDLTLTMLCL